ncbi:MAG TPA: maltotransferase domain-containing protein, partial [Acidimicrobiia bacterium]
MPRIQATNKRVVIESVSPEVERGSFPAKSTVGDPVTVEADVFADGHDEVRSVLRHRKATARNWTETPMG